MITSRRSCATLLLLCWASTCRAYVSLPPEVSGAVTQLSDQLIAGAAPAPAPTPVQGGNANANANAALGLSGSSAGRGKGPSAKGAPRTLVVGSYLPSCPVP